MRVALLWVALVLAFAMGAASAVGLHYELRKTDHYRDRASSCAVTVERARRVVQQAWADDARGRGDWEYAVMGVEDVLWESDCVGGE